MSNVFTNIIGKYRLPLYWSVAIISVVAETLPDYAISIGI